MVDNVLDKFYQLDILICNAGIAHEIVGDLTDDDWRRMSPSTWTACFTPSGLKPCPTSSTARRGGSSPCPPWGRRWAAPARWPIPRRKGRSNQYKGFGQGAGPSGITVNCVSPGVISSEMNAHLDREALAALAEETPWGHRHPGGRGGGYLVSLRRRPVCYQPSAGPQRRAGNLSVRFTICFIFYKGGLTGRPCVF